MQSPPTFCKVSVTVASMLVVANCFSDIIVKCHKLCQDIYYVTKNVNDRKCQISLIMS
jgi:hypothetical protein